ncbi:hypothetical protein HRbin10_00011 [bacterium HR10]|nr:hypothetical protein HRbin10_00011 [bacterium HR10]
MRRPYLLHGSLIAALIAGLSPASTHPLQWGTGKISGRVLSDTGRPVKYARVELHRIAETGSLFVAETRADAHGAFAFENLPPGTYALRASQVGFFSERDPTLTDPLELPEGGHLQNVELRLTAGGAISGWIRDEEGDPVIAAEVLAIRLQDSGETVYQGSVQTDDRGVYRLSGLPPGRYVIGVRIPDGQGYRGALRYFPGVLSREEASLIPVSEGQDITGIDIELKPLQGARLMGRVIREHGRHPVRARVMLSGQDLISLSTHTDADGRYEFSELPEGTYHLRVEPLEGEVVGLAQYIHIPSRRPVHQDFVLHDAGQVRGRVELDDRRPLDPTHSLILSLTVTQLEESNRALSSFSRPVEPDGTFHIGGLPKGRVRFSIFSPNERYAMKALALGNRIVPGFELSIQPGTTLSDVRVILSSEVGEIYGRVSAPKGDLTSYRILLVPEDPAKWKDPQEVRVAWTTGVQPFVLRGVLAGRYWILATPMDTQLSTEALIQQGLSSALRITVHPHRAIEVTVPLVFPEGQ